MCSEVFRRVGCRFRNAQRKCELKHTGVVFRSTRGRVEQSCHYLRLAGEYVEVAARARIKTHGHGIHKRKQFIDNILSDFQLDIGIFHAYQSDERLDDVCGFRRKRAGSISAGSCVSGGVSVRKRLGCRAVVRIGTAFGDSVENRGKVDIKAAHERAEVTGKFVYNFGSFHLDGAHAYAGKVKPQIAVAHIYAYQRGSLFGRLGSTLVDSHIIQLEADHVQLYVIRLHGSVEREHEVETDGFAVLLGNEFKRGIAQVDYAADHLLGNAQQVEALLLCGVRGQAECDSRSKYFVEYARDQSGGISIAFRRLYLAVLFGYVIGYAYFTRIAGHGAAYADTRVEGDGYRLAAESTGRGYPQRFIRAGGLFSHTYGHVKVHGRNVSGDVRHHQRKQTEYGLRSDDELQLGAVYRQIVVIIQTGGRQRRLRRAAFGGEHYGAAFFACGKFQAVIVAGGILGIDCDIVAWLRNRGVAAA